MCLIDGFHWIVSVNNLLHDILDGTRSYIVCDVYMFAKHLLRNQLELLFSAFRGKGF